MRGNLDRVQLRTTTGAGVVITTVLGAVPAGLLGLELAWLVVALGGAILGLSAWSAARATRAVQVADAPRNARAVAGRTVSLPIELRVVARTPPLTLAVLEASARRGVEGAVSRVGLLPLRRGSRVRARVLARFGRRGVHDRVALEIATSFPFGLIEARRHVPLACEVAVAPRPARAPFPSLMRWTQSRGERAAQELVPEPRGLARDLPDGLREARGRETAREIAWRASARAGRPVALERRANPRPAGVDVVLVKAVLGADQSARRRDDDAFESAVATAQALLNTLQRRGLRVRFALSDARPEAPPTELVASAHSHTSARSAIRRRLVEVTRASEGGRLARLERSGPSAPSRSRARRGGRSSLGTIVLLPATPLAIARAQRAGLPSLRPESTIALVQVAPKATLVVAGEGAAR